MKYFLFITLLIMTSAIFAGQTQVGLWAKFEKVLVNKKNYSDPFSQTALVVEFFRPDQTMLKCSGFYDGGVSWKFRVMPDQIGEWKYVAWFSDRRQHKIVGSFKCVPSDIPGLISVDETNPVWFGFKGGKHHLIRSFHVGDRFFASNWPDSARRQFLDWIIENKYNTISVASHLLNRNDQGRGSGWLTPDLWNSEKQQPNPLEYSKMERILDELAARKIVVFPFAGFFGQKSNCPTEITSQTLYVSYTISRLGAYWNTIYSVAGPEPLYRNVKQFTKEEVDKLGTLIADNNTQNHLLSVHNEKNSNPFINAPWASYQCLQGPTTINLDTLYSGLMRRRNLHQPLFAQEVLWYGNKYQQAYTDEQLRKNAFTIVMAGAALNFADNLGISSTGFSGTLNLSEKHQDKHEIIFKVWNFFESIPFYQLTPQQNISDTGFSMAASGEIYLTYLPIGGTVTVKLLTGNFKGYWIKGADTNLRIDIGRTDGKNLVAPTLEDWFLLIQKIK